MKRIGITQRVELIKNYGERRDCLDQQWFNFAFALGHIAVPLPNVSAKYAASYIENFRLDGIILSGGNSIATLDSSAEDAAPERDEFEIALLTAALDKSIPVLGVCRGMQVINVALNGKLEPVSGHVAQKHQIFTCSSDFTLPDIVNSFHNYCIPAKGLAKTLTPLATDNAGNIEAYFDSQRSILGVMWHPEREIPFSQLDIQLFKRFLL
ncbi:type 1 glutamine amidotransferase [Litorilituus lipolyticus]|uniref:Peptidase C26 n=1 Tax=Litorilituus lipolyticus TaxID=2491017 RepID=A0A502KZP2_9GAMM|nr:type 1 glutamine amidotransferase [Litorilituus lipolyticus]TPH17082.1 peptidase C26 [Litorilituus lipolyticus]